MSCENYSKPFIGWAQNIDAPDYLILGNKGLLYNEGAIILRAILMNKG